MIRHTLTAVIAMAAATAVAVPAADAHDLSRKHRHTKDGTVVYGATLGASGAGVRRSYRNVPYDARAHSVDPGGTYKDYPNWARWALSPKSSGGRS